MTGLFEVNYFDPKNRNTNIAESWRVIASDAEYAIRMANRQKSLKQYRVESVVCRGFIDE